MSAAAAFAPGAAAPPRRVPPLREELTLHPGPRTRAGVPTWTLQDPANNRFFRIGWAEFEMLSRWELGEMDAIAQAVSRDTTLEIGPERVEAFTRFLAAGNLIQVRGEQAMGVLVRQVMAQRKHWAAWLLKHYLFFRIPVIRPDRLLAAGAPVFGWLFSPAFLLAALAAAVLGGWLAARQWDAFINSFLHFFSIEGAILAAAALGAAKLLHEFGHAFVAHRYGCRVPTMGLAFLVLWPVLYTDTSEAWKLPSRRQRLAIAAAGMGAELALAAFATLAWSFLPDGPLRSACFLLATTTWILTLAINLNPFMRFDGYYLLADWLDIANLQDRSFALARWWLRERLFGFGDPRPERFAPGLERFLILYAFATWIYRFFLFLGIALLVYHLFFKALGILLFAVEIAWFIFRPITNEIGVWIKRRKEVGLNVNSALTLAAVAAAVVLLAVPWRSTVSGAALMRAEQQSVLYAPEAARLERVLVRPGERVAAGQVLFAFSSPDLAHQVAQTRRTVDSLSWRSQVQSLSTDLAERSQVVWRELEQARSQLAGYEAELERLTVAAPFAGTIVDMADPLAPGEWLEPDMPLALVIDARAALIEAYVDEADLSRFAAGAPGWFRADDPAVAPVALRVERIDDASSRVLREPMLSSTHGGSIAARETQDRALVPETPVYRVLLRPRDPLPAPPRVLRGTVDIEGERESVAARLWRVALGVLVRESGF
ncbi:HlyD family efflux transporter periplasmic adaptor subunit [Arenibaculum sp.]|uniref:HlyD family efflux transporter periplasmic adaptor subunit n=1 Tax=Arenibaculum sp. TaxID=2865862 RepID=UPI002E0D52ED|nr:HlyD family efflux transporter periplasmic adaptor subunit [Arenibaculum sp.]